MNVYIQIYGRKSPLQKLKDERFRLKILTQACTLFQGTSLVCGRLAVKTPPASANRSGMLYKMMSENTV